MLMRCISFLMIFPFVENFWPPPYEIDLHQNETFEIFEDLRTDDQEIAEEEDEMIGKSELQRLKFDMYNHKFEKLHRITQENNKIMEQFRSSNGKYVETNFDAEESVPKVVGFVGEEGTLERVLQLANYEGNVAIIEDPAKTDSKRENKESIEEYDYDRMKERYEANLEKEKNEKSILKYKEMKEKESAKDALKTILKEKDEINCTLEELRGIGWCCCCFRCILCRPYDRINHVKEFYMQNPVGTVRDEYDNIVEYQPTAYEKYYQKQLGEEIKKLISF